MYLIFDTETTGLPKRWDAPITDVDNWPRAIQIAWQLHDDMGNLVEHQDYLIKPEGFNIPFDAEKIHGISTELAEQEGLPLDEVLEKFQKALSKSTKPIWVSFVLKNEHLLLSGDKLIDAFDLLNDFDIKMLLLKNTAIIYLIELCDMD